MQMTEKLYGEDVHCVVNRMTFEMCEAINMGKQVFSIYKI